MKLKTRSVLLGLLAIVCWGSLATLGTLTNHLPPFYVLGVGFFLGALPAFFRPREMFPSLKISLWGVFGYFGYHFFLFYSFRHAPAIEANLINYLWPMLIVVLSPLFFKDSKLHWYHLLGACLSSLGCVVLVASKGVEFKLENFYGHLLALGAAVTWPIYSIGKKKMRAASTWSVGGSCLGASVLSFSTHALIEPHVVLQIHDAWILLLMGIGPFAIAFYAWDKAMAFGDTRVIGALSYLTPLLSTLGLILFTYQTPTSSTFMAMVLIIGGASSGLLDFLPSKALNNGLDAG